MLTAIQIVRLSNADSRRLIAHKTRNPEGGRKLLGKFRFAIGILVTQRESDSLILVRHHQGGLRGFVETREVAFGDSLAEGGGLFEIAIRRQAADHSPS